jgi:hypothetical protein
VGELHQQAGCLFIAWADIGDDVTGEDAGEFPNGWAHGAVRSNEGSTGGAWSAELSCASLRGRWGVAVEGGTPRPPTTARRSVATLHLADKPRLADLGLRGDHNIAAPGRRGPLRAPNQGVNFDSTAGHDPHST